MYIYVIDTILAVELVDLLLTEIFFNRHLTTQFVVK